MPAIYQPRNVLYPVQSCSIRHLHGVRYFDLGLWELRAEVFLSNKALVSAVVACFCSGTRKNVKINVTRQVEAQKRRDGIG
jgi:hypothetical protein